MKHRIVFYPTLYKSVVIQPPHEQEVRHTHRILLVRCRWFRLTAFRVGNIGNGMKQIPIIQGYKKPLTLVGGKYGCLTTELAHRTNSYGLPHVLELYET